MRSADSDETMRWRRKFEDLSALRVTQAEKTLAELQKSAQKQTASAEAVISALRKENEELRRQIKKDGEKQQDPAELETRKALEKDVKVLQQQVETLSLDLVTKDAQIEQLEHHQRLAETSVDFNLRDSLRILQMISGLTIEEVVPEDQGMSYKCLQAGPTLTIGYVLTVFDDLPEEFQYTPYEETAELDVLPDFLRETMSFSQDSASLFFWRVCDHLNQIALQEPATNGNL
ncbi:hypothetical protein EC988_008932 [Linderina pennispora]|nr:hypothetical protein EC988_008932 [Linderina pennispora]